MGHQRSYSWESKLQMVQLLETGEQNPSQISLDHYVTRSLLYVWWQLYRERGEAAFVPTQAFASPPEVDRPHTVQELIAHLERVCGQQALELDLLKSRGCPRYVVRSVTSVPIQERHAIIERLREQMQHLSVRKLCRSLGGNRHWYYQQRCPSARQQDDERLRQAIQELREAFTGYGYRRVTKVLGRAGRISQPQTGLEGHARDPADLPSETTNSLYD